MTTKQLTRHAHSLLTDAALTGAAVLLLLYILR